uniref:Signal peptidase complex subunit 2 n=1 Tax=Arcella intermedia TaxID=1963864 RepID=A0A6B2LLN9_9EUKA
MNVYDTNMIKLALDDHAKMIVLETYPHEHVRNSNIKLVLGAFGCLLGITSHYAPIPFPAIIPLLVVCVVLYSITSLILQYRATYIEQDIILTASNDSGKTIRLHSDIELKPNNQELIYELTFVDGKSLSKAGGFKLQKSIVNYFDEKGKFYPHIFRNDISKALSKVRKDK